MTMTTFRDTIMLVCVRGNCVMTNPMSGKELFETDELTAISVFFSFLPYPVLITVAIGWSSRAKLTS